MVAVFDPPLSRALPGWLVVFLCWGLWAGSPSAQAPSPWAATPANQGAQVLQRGKLLIEQGPQDVAIFSAFTRRWHRIPVGPQAILRHANDWCLIQEGSQWTGFSAYTGEFATVSLGATASVLNPISQRNDSLVVLQDGSRLWVWSGFAGTWDDLLLPAGTASRIVVQRHVLVVAAGQQLWGRSAWGDRWHSALATQAVVGVAADGTAGIAYTAAGLWGFSAQHEVWRFTPMAAGGRAPSRLLGDVALWQNANEVVAFSGLAGVFARVVIAAPPRAVQVDRQCAAVELAGPMGPSVLLYSAVTGQWLLLSAQGGAGSLTVRTQPALVTIEEPDRVHGFSALTGAVSTLRVVPSGVLATRGVAVAADPSGGLHLYSAMTDGWFAAPGVSGAVTTAQLGAVGAIVSAGSGSAQQVWAFRAEDGSFVSAPRQRIGSPVWVHVDAESAALGVSEEDWVHAFDGRTASWVSASLPGTAAPQVGQWRTNLVTVRGTLAAGFGMQVGSWSVQDLGAVPTNLRSSSEATLIETPAQAGGAGSQRWGFGAVPDLLGQWQFPAFRRIHTAGAAIRLWQLRAPGATTFVVVGPWGPMPIPGLGAGSPGWPGRGLLFFDPTTSGVLRVLGPAEGGAIVANWAVAIAPSASLRGTAWAFQSLVVDRSGFRAGDPLGLQVW